MNHYLVLILIAPAIWSCAVLACKKIRNPSRYFVAFFHQLHLPYLGVMCIRNPSDKALKDKYWDLKVCCIFELEFQNYIKLRKKKYHQKFTKKIYNGNFRNK